MDMVKALAGSRAQSLVPGALECPICQEVMMYPYAIPCGHTFCGTCLKHWFETPQQDEEGRTCPSCRNGVKSPPILVHALRELANNVVDAIKTTDPDRAAQLLELAAPDPGPAAFEDHHFSNPIHDREDGVLRCQYCQWEIQDGFCEGCGRPHITVHSHTDEDEDMSELESQEISADEEDDGFINDEEIEYETEESDPDAITNIVRPRRAFIDDESDDFEEDPKEIQDSEEPESDLPEVVTRHPRVISIESSEDEEEEGRYYSSSEEAVSTGESDQGDQSDDSGAVPGNRRMPIVLSDTSDAISSEFESS